MPDIDETRYSRNLGLLGREGQRRVQTTRVGIVGLGGLGSHVAQQLAHLGVRSFVLIDPDHVEISNLNRLIGATAADVGSTKVAVAERVIRDLQADAEIRSVVASSDSEESRTSIVTSDCILGCVDNDPGRLELTRLSSERRIPYFDLASDAGHDTGGTWYGGRVFVSLDGERCLSCAGELDQRELALASMDAAQREADERIYGVDTTALDGSGPMVVSINGVVASLGVTEFIAWVTGLRQAKPHLVYRGDLGIVTVRAGERDGSCYYCDSLWRS